MPVILTNNSRAADLAKYVALVTCLMSLPVILTFNVIYGKPLHGTFYDFLLDWWLLSIYAVPVLIVLGLIIAIWTVVSPKRRKGSSLRWNLLGIVVGVVAVVVEIIVIRMLPRLP
jgi:hypothetical protein